MGHVITEKIKGGLRVSRSCHLMRIRSRFRDCCSRPFGIQARTGITTSLRLIQAKNLKLTPTLVSLRQVLQLSIFGPLASSCKELFTEYYSRHFDKIFQWLILGLLRNVLINRKIYPGPISALIVKDRLRPRAPRLLARFQEGWH